MPVTPQINLPTTVVDENPAVPGSGTALNAASVMPNFTGLRDGLNNHTHTEIGSGSGPAPAVFSNPGFATVGNGVSRFPITAAGTITGVVATANTAPTGASLIFDVLKNGVTVFTGGTGRPTIAAGAYATASAAVPAVTAVAAGDYLTVNIAQVGSTIPGSDIVVRVNF